MSIKQTDRKHRAAKGGNGRSPSDALIDTSDIPPLGDDFFASAARNPFYRPLKQSTTVRLDADIVAWLKAQGPGYQTRLNAILREAMLRDAAGASIGSARKSRSRL
jgi:uncharacterized protein (DUF4415 family)